MNKYSFTLKDTNIAKGFFILAMIFHHVFSPEMDSFLKISTGVPTPYLLFQISFYCKICVGGFAFLSAYGITKKLMSMETSFSNDSSVIITRLVKFYFSYWPIFLLGFVGSILFGDIPLTKLYISPHKYTFSWILPVIDALGLSNLFGTPTLNVSWWYISVALFIILVTPFYNRLYSSFKFAFVGSICLFPYAIGMQELNIFFTVPVIGIMFAREDILARLKSTFSDKWWKKVLKLLFSLIMIYFTFELSNSLVVLTILPLGTVACMYFCLNILSDIPVLRNVLEFFGKHSANIFFVHTFLYYYWFTYSIYNLGNKFLIYTIVFVGALIISILLELFKKIVRYNKLEQSVISHLIKIICK